ncbi:hypothetical protein H671_6g15428 [Cricetulus griseus]|nr:hypothetical protein H671_6g15428 [Cricetulus griseus]
MESLPSWNSDLECFFRKTLFNQEQMFIIEDIGPLPSLTYINYLLFHYEHEAMRSPGKHQVTCVRKAERMLTFQWILNSKNLELILDLTENVKSLFFSEIPDAFGLDLRVVPQAPDASSQHRSLSPQHPDLCMAIFHNGPLTYTEVLTSGKL